MRKCFPFVLLLAGLGLLLYPQLSQCLTGIAQHRAVAAYTAADADTDLIGYLTIPSLQLTLPIRSGTSETILRDGTGLMEGTSFSEHAVLCGHRGLPESRLFRDLDRLAIGDFFTVTTGDHTITYQVDQILVVTPDDTQVLLPVPGQALCTLLTCTPYGINSHRLLIRGKAAAKIP